MAILGTALTKLLFEAGELALYNPGVLGTGKQPEFKLDEHGMAPAFSLSHVIAATRVWRERAAEAAAQKQAERDQASAAA